MEFLFFWLGTTITSFCMEMGNELRMFKDVADAGYKIDVKRMSEIQKQLNPSGAKLKLLLMLVPIINYMQVFKNTMDYNNIRPMVLDQLSALNVLEEMTEIEKQEYLKKPTGLNAIVVPIKMEVRLMHASSINFTKGDVTGEIFYEWKNRKSLDDITILKVTGEISKLSVEEQKEKIIEAYKDLIKQGVKKYGSVDGLVDALISNSNIDLITGEEEKEEKSEHELSTREKIQELETLKNEIINQQNVQNNDEETELRLTKKRK